jgi:hypothetical protein
MRVYKKLLLILIIPVVFISGCLDIPDEIILPQWDVDLNLPIVNRTYTLHEVIGDQDNLEIETPDSIYLIHSREYTQVRNLLEFIKLVGAISQENVPIPPVNGSTELFLNFRNDVVEVESAVFAEGHINLDIRNTSSVNVSFTITIPGIRLNQTELVLTASLAPGENATINQDLAGYEYYDPPNQPPLFSNTLWIQAESQASGTNTGGNVLFDIEISDFYFSSVTGRVSEQVIEPQTDTIRADLGTDLDDFRNKISLASASLVLSAQYHSVHTNPFNLRVDSLSIIARSEWGDVYLVDSTGSRYMTLLVEQGSIHIDFNQDNSNIIELINSVPDEFIITAGLTILGENQSGTITNQDFSNISLEVSTHSILAIGRSTVMDTLRVNISNDERDDIRNAQLSSFSLDVLNAIPVQGWLKLDFLDSLRNHLFTLQVDNRDSLNIAGAQVNVNNGEVTSPSATFRYVDLTREEILMLAEAYYAVTSVTVETSAYREFDPPLVIVRASDWLKVNIYGRVKYRVDF